MPVRRHPVRGKTGNHRCRAEERLGRSHVAGLAEHGVDQVSVPVDSPVEIAPAALDLEIRLVDIPTPAGTPMHLPPPLAQSVTHDGQKLGFPVQRSAHRIALNVKCRP